jgi:DNA/RNA endonuclease G (NUC1)
LRRNLVWALAVLCLLSVNASAQVVISQVYGGGGNSGATYTHDFVELFNRGSETVAITGWSVQYASATGSTWAVTPLSGSIAPGHYYLVQQAQGAGGTTPLPTPDAAGTTAMAATNGKVALVSSTAALGGTCPAGAPNVVDFVGFGSTANCFEGAGPTATLSNTTAAHRADKGCTDTNQNNSDFSTGSPTPRNSASPTTSCDPAAPTAPTGIGSASPASVFPGGATTFTVAVTPGLNPDSTGISVTGDLTSIGGVSGQPFADQGDGSFTYVATVASHVTPGSKSIPVTIEDAQGRTGSASIALNVLTPVGPPDHVVISQVYGGGGNSGATFNRDFVELYNPTGTMVDLGGWSLQYASSTGSSWGSNNTSQPLAGEIGPGEYFLVALASGGATGADLPEANVLGAINMAAANGKIALVSNTDLLSGTCPLSDPDVVDFVGYGSANCWEGTGATAALSNTTAAFRNGGGAVDTNDNASDFTIGTPSPRRTAPIMEVGPSVSNTDPATNGFNAPRDGSITITFSEAVTVDPSWFSISCASSGLHNDATVAGTGKLRVITPNVNFQQGEQCTVTIFADRVHDEDLDDAAPGTDTLPADHIWSFTVASGAPPPYPADVHLTFGNPTGATPDISTPNNYLMEKPEYALSYNRDRGTPNWVSWHLSDDWTGFLTRFDTFRPDPQVPPDWYRVQAFDYSGSGFDRGHVIPSADRNETASRPINQATFLMTNMFPQAPDNNQGPWANLEMYLRSLLPANELYIVSGGAGVGGHGFNGFATTIANGQVTVPAYTWKVALVLPKMDGNDVARVDASTRTIAVIMPNVQGIRTTNPTDWEAYLTSVDAVEALTGYDFFANLPDAIENAIEAGVNGVNPPGAADQFVAVHEDVAKSFTLDAVGGGSLTWTILTGPAFGTLEGAEGSRTYTPAPDFFGDDSFTYRVDDGTSSSGIAEVTLVVLPVNDPPVAGDDAKTTNDDTTLVFPASDLLANDVPGPANESDQTLTVTAVIPGATTHGTVSLESGVITYVPGSRLQRRSELRLSRLRRRSHRRGVGSEVRGRHG